MVEMQEGKWSKQYYSKYLFLFLHLSMNCMDDQFLMVSLSVLTSLHGKPLDAFITWNSTILNNPVDVKTPWKEFWLPQIQKCRMARFRFDVNMYYTS